RLDAALGQVAMADFAPLRRTHHTGLTDAERRKIVVQHERFFALASEPVDDLRIAARAQSRHHQCLRFTASEQSGTVGSRQYAGANIDAAHGLRVAAID